MDTIPAGQPLIDLIRICYKANRPLLLSGKHGVGKSEILRQGAEALGIQFICRDLSLMEPTDLVGLPTAKGAVTTFLPPAFLPTAGRGILVFEELNRCERYMRAPCLQLMTARELNDYQLPPGWLQVAAINPPDTDYQVSELDPALLSRFVQVEVTPDRQVWLSWARGNGIHPSVLDYVEQDPTVFDAADSNPRAWVYVSDILHAAELDSTSPRHPNIRTAVLGCVGDERGRAFLAALNSPSQPIPAKQILCGYNHYRDTLRNWVEAGRTDLLKSTLHGVLTTLQPEADFQVVHESPEQWRGLGMFFRDLPGDLHAEAENYFTERNYPFPTPKKSRQKKVS